MSPDSCTLFCGNIPEETTEEILFELFLQAGPVADVRIPSYNGRNKNYGFIVFKHECSIEYAEKLMENTELFGNKLTVRPASMNGNREPAFDVTPSIKDRLGPKMDSHSLRGFGDDFRKRRNDNHMMPQNLKKRIDSSPSPYPDINLIQQLESSSQMMMSLMDGNSNSYYNNANNNFCYNNPTLQGSRVYDSLKSVNYREPHLDRSPYYNEEPYRDDRYGQGSRNERHFRNSSRDRYGHGSYDHSRRHNRIQQYPNTHKRFK